MQLRKCSRAELIVRQNPKEENIMVSSFFAGMTYSWNQISIELNCEGAPRLHYHRVSEDLHLDSSFARR